MSALIATRTMRNGTSGVGRGGVDALSLDCHAPPAMLRCEECGCLSEAGKGWFAYIVEDPEGIDDPLVCTYCPPCAQWELEARPRSHRYI